MTVGKDSSSRPHRAYHGKQPMETMMADLSIETQISAITDQIKELLKERNELGPLDVVKDHRIQTKISRLHERRVQLKKALTGQSPEQ